MSDPWRVPIQRSEYNRSAIAQTHAPRTHQQPCDTHRARGPAGGGPTDGALLRDGTRWGNPRPLGGKGEAASAGFLTRVWPQWPYHVIVIRPLEYVLKPAESWLFCWSGRPDSNGRPSAPKADALPDCATPRAPERKGSAARAQGRWCSEAAARQRVRHRCIVRSGSAAMVARAQRERKGDHAHPAPHIAARLPAVGVRTSRRRRSG